MTSWLPALLRPQEFGNDWDKYLEAVYASFRGDFVTKTALFRQRKISLKKYPTIEGKEATFWHLITSGSDESSRTPDGKRCERIKWPRAIIDNEIDQEVKVWFNFRKSERRILLFLENEGYLVVLAERKTYLLLWTAYPIETSHHKMKLLKEYNDFIKKLESPP
jgi:hypothetical protein